MVPLKLDMSDDNLVAGLDEKSVLALNGSRVTDSVSKLIIKFLFH
jgi:poly(A) polymerase Pap1